MYFQRTALEEWLAKRNEMIMLIIALVIKAREKVGENKGKRYPGVEKRQTFRRYKQEETVRGR